MYLFDSVFESELSEAIPVVYVSIGGCRIIGRMVVGQFSLLSMCLLGWSTLVYIHLYFYVITNNKYISMSLHNVISV